MSTQTPLGPGCYRNTSRHLVHECLWSVTKGGGAPLEYWGGGGAWRFFEINIFVGKMGEINK